MIAVRADAYGRCAEHGPLSGALRDSTLLVGPTTPTPRQAVVRCARAGGGLTTTEWRRHFPSSDYRATCGT